MRVLHGIFAFLSLGSGLLCLYRGFIVGPGDMGLALFGASGGFLYIARDWAKKAGLEDQV